MKSSHLKSRLLASATGMLAVLASPMFALAATVVGGVGNGGWGIGIFGGNGGGGFGAYGCNSTICGVAGTILYLINSVAVPVLFAVSFIVFLYGVANRYIFHPDDVSSGHTFILWGVVGFAVMISLWGLVNVVANTFGLAGYYAPPLPTSYSTY